MPPLEGFHQVLQIQVPAKISIGRGVTIWTQPPPDIGNCVKCGTELGRDCISALSFLAKGPFFFPFDPTVDPLERMVTPGAGRDFRSELIESAGITDPMEVDKSHAFLNGIILPAHESRGHIEINLSATKSSFDFKAVWFQLQQCLDQPDINRFLDFPYTTSEDMLFQHYILATMHELYALIKEEQAWKKLSGLNDIAPTALKIRESIRKKQDPTIVRLLQFLIRKTGNDLSKITKAVDELVIKTDMSLSHAMPHMLRDLARGGDPDDLVDRVLEQTYARFSPEYSNDGFEDAMERQQKTAHDFYSSPPIKAMFTTHMSLSYDESCVKITFYSQEKEPLSIRAIPHMLTIWEAKRILDRSGSDFPISPLRSMERSWTLMLAEIAYGKYKERRTMNNFDAMADFKNFYLTWRPALLQAKKAVFENGKNQSGHHM